MTKAKKPIKIYFKYSFSPWSLYDQTRDESWADVQFERMKQDHPGAEYKREPEAKEKK
jgi:hypothetical protein